MIALDRAPALLPPGMFAQAPPTDERLMMGAGGREDIHEQVDKWHSKQGTAVVLVLVQGTAVAFQARYCCS